MEVDSNKIKLELGKVGIFINDIYDLVNTKEQYPLAVPVLIDLLKEGIESNKTKEGVIRALAVKDAVGKASSVLISEYHRIPKEQMLLRWAIGNTIFTTITDTDVDSILEIIIDKENGISRQMFVAALGKVKSTKAESVLIELLNDDQVIAHALEALGRMKSKKAIEKITNLTNNQNALVKKEAQKALKKILQ